MKQSKFDPGPEKGEIAMVMKIGKYEAVTRVSKCPKCNGPVYTCSRGYTSPCTTCNPILKLKK